MKKDNASRRQFLRNASLASLTLGISPSIASSAKPNKITEATACDVTTEDFYGQGPFYTPNAPTITGGLLAATNEVGQRIMISGRVRTLDCTKIIPDAVIDIWHANDAGEYDNAGFHLRGITKSNAQGFYLFETILPGKYLNGALFRPSHIHFLITPPNYPTLTTQLYFEGDTSIPADAAASITSGPNDARARIIPLEDNGQGMKEGVWDIVIDGEGIVGANNIHLDKGMVYNASPNPFQNKLSIKYGVFQRAKIALKVFNMKGQLVSSLEERELSPEIYHAEWTPEYGTPDGHYFIVLQVNDIQVHYLKVLLAG